MIDQHIDLLSRALEQRRPLVLFAGQYIDSTNDAILDAFLNHLNCTSDERSWKGALRQNVSAADMKWLSERFERNVPSHRVSIIHEFPWNAVFTSSIDPRFGQRFETRGRLPEEVLSKDTYPKAPRSRSRPPIHYLFGKSDETMGDTCAPGTLSDFTVRLNMHASALLGRIADTATPRGIVVIEGYKPEEDWLSIDRLLSPLYQSSVKILWFGNVHELDSALAQKMLKYESLFVTQIHLSDAIEKLKESKSLEGSIVPDEPGTVSVSESAALYLTPALRLRVEASAAIVDDEWTIEPDPIAPDVLDQAFRRFHSTPGNFRLLVKGIRRGFSIEREFEHVLWKKVNDQLQKLGKPDSENIVILHGQSGTGKTISLARLTYKIRKQLQLPVLVSTNRVPDHSDVEDFCRECERIGASATILICDYNEAPRRYDDLASAIRSRGRRLLIIGTSYRTENQDSPSRHLIEASTDVSNSELKEFKQLLKDFNYENALQDVTLFDQPRSILAMFYRSLPASRERLADGIASEAIVHKGTLRARARRVPYSEMKLSSLANQLIQTGIVNPTFEIFQENEQLSSLRLDAAGRLLDQVMTAGRLNCSIPVNLIFRSLSSYSHPLDIDQIIHSFFDLDIFRWRTNEDGSDFQISPRIQLEAELLCIKRLTPEQEIDRLIELISNVRLGLEDSLERHFLLDILTKIGRNGPRGTVYNRGYLRFADALQNLRQQYGVFDPTLVLRECVFRRQTVQTVYRKDHGKTEDEQLAILDQARNVIEETLHRIDKEGFRLNKRTRQSLLAERSAIYGYLAVQNARSESGKEFWSDYLAARAASEKTIGHDYHPIDISLWTACDVLEKKRNELSAPQKAELFADLYSVLELADDIFKVQQTTSYKKSTNRAQVKDYENSDQEGLASVDQKVKYLQRRYQVTTLIGDMELANQGFIELEDVAPATATFLTARRIAEKVYANRSPYGETERKVAADAASYISERLKSGFPLDHRCRRLLLKLRWVQATGEALMFHQRGRTPSYREQISDLRTIVSNLNRQLGTDARSRERFLEAVLAWLSGDTNRASEIWRLLSRDTEYEDRSRVVRWLIATGENGDSKQYRGRIRRKGNEDWQLIVEGIDKPIAVLPRDFSGDDLMPGRELRGFGIAFNYIGPIADPLSRPMRS